MSPSKHRTDLQAEALKFVLFNKLVKVNIHQLECDTLVIAEIKMIQHVNNTASSILILSSQVIL